jgi:hypothetical protein
MELSNLTKHEYVNLDQALKGNKQVYTAPRSKKPFYIGMALLLIASVALYANKETTLPGVNYPAVHVPPFNPGRSIGARFRLANAMIFKANVLAQMVGYEGPSNFANVLSTWHYHVRHFKKEMSAADYTNAVVIEKMMKMYLDKKRGDGLEYQNFWLKVFPTFGFENGASLTPDRSYQATDKPEYAFWAKAEQLISQYRNGLWVDAEGKQVQAEFAGVTLNGKRLASSVEDYWKGAWGPEPLKDNLGNSFYTKNLIAAEIFNHNKEKLGFNFSMKQAVKNEGLRFLNIFESARLGNNLDSDDHQFCGAIESMIGAWVAKPNSKLLSDVQEVFGV